jgi:hypothetical protein
VINYDTRKRPGRRADWERLLLALFEADKKDEAHWLEFKIVNWGKPAHLAIVSRAIIAMANRDPGRALDQLEGRGLLVLGMEPGRAPGVEPLDPSDLEGRLSPYLGEVGPDFDQHWLPLNGVEVLVIEVRPPAAGDPIFVLQRGGGDYKAGQVFFRDGSRSLPATPVELDRLAQRRVNVRDRVLDIDVNAFAATPIRPYYWDQDEIERWLSDERDDLIGSLRADEARISQVKGSLTMMLEAGERAQDVFSVEVAETRSAGLFLAEVEAYIQALREALPAAMLDVLPRLIAPPAFVLSNRSKNNYKKVEVTLSVIGDARAARVPPEYVNDDWTMAARLPRRPRRYGDYRAITPALRGLANATYSTQLAQSVFNSVSYDEPLIENGGSFRLVLLPVTLRPRDTEVELEDGIAVLIPKDRVEPVTFTWRATATNIHDEAEGSFVLPIDGEPLNVFAAWREVKARD